MRSNPAPLFHIARTSSRASIRSKGLAAGRGSRRGSYVTTDPHGWLFMFGESGIYRTDSVDIWSVDTGGLELRDDENETAEPGQDFFVPHDIPPSRLDLVETIEIEPTKSRTMRMNPDGVRLHQSRANPNGQFELFLRSVEDGLPKGVDVSLSPGHDDNDVTLDQIYAHVPGRGVGTKAMRLIVREADKFRMRIVLRVEKEVSDEDDDEGDLNHDRLVSWYRKFGFTYADVYDEGFTVMVRPVPVKRHVGKGRLTKAKTRAR